MLRQHPQNHYTVSGRQWPLTAPTADHVHWPDIAEALSKICRFNGHTQSFYSVAQHCCLVADILPLNERLFGLLHDAHEAFLGDVTSPLKMALAKLGAKAAFDDLAAITDQAIYTAAGLEFPVPLAIKSRVKSADLLTLATERRDILSDNKSVDWGCLPDPLPKQIKPWPWPKAMEQFMDRLDRYPAKGSF